MTMVEIRCEVERRLTRWCEEPVDGAEDGTEDEGAESGITLRSLASSSYEECGVRYQKCGGGRRVIRRKGGE